MHRNIYNYSVHDLAVFHYILQLNAQSILLFRALKLCLKHCTTLLNIPIAQNKYCNKSWLSNLLKWTPNPVSQQPTFDEVIDSKDNNYTADDSKIDSDLSGEDSEIELESKDDILQRNPE